MTRYTTTVAMTIAAMALRAEAQAPGRTEAQQPAPTLEENLIVNGRLEADQSDVPGFWNPPEHARIGEGVFFEQSGGPDGIPCVRFANHGEPFTEASFRQTGFTLVPGAKYRLSGMVRTKGFKGRGVLFVINYGWIDEDGIEGFPEDSPWTRYEREIVAPGNQQPKNYMVVLGAVNYTGEISFADLSLVPLDEAAKKGSAPPNAAKSEKEPRFFPWSPYLNEIDSATRRVVFRFAGELPSGDTPGDYMATLKTPDGETSAPLQDGENHFTLPGSIAEGPLEYEVRRKGAAEPLLKGGFHFMTRAEPAIDTTGHRRLNNLVTEVLDAPLVEGETAFTTTRDGWVWVCARPEGPCVKLDGPGEKGPEEPCRVAVLLDGEPLFAAVTNRCEAFRLLPAGRHTLALSEVEARGVTPRVTVRQIPEIFNYPACANSAVNTNPSYGWEFYSRHVLPNCTTHNGGRIPEEHWPEFKERGCRFLANFGTRGLDAETVASKVAASAGLTAPRHDGVTLDESMFGNVELFGDYVGAMRRLSSAYDGDRVIYSWMVNKPMLAGLDREIFALAANATRSGGHVLSEIYCRSRPTEAEARKYIDDYIADTIRRFRELRKGEPFYPNALARVGVILANFSQIPTLSCWHHQQTDYKYFLDMQFNALANNEVFDGLGCVGVWGSYYADEEIYRWTFMLARHYCIEGNTAMLSEKYGLKYRADYVANGDFEDGLDGWRADGDVSVRRIRGLAENVERRWGGAAAGDAFAVLAMGNLAVTGKAHERQVVLGETAIRQTLRKLVPGRMYSLDVTCFDAKDAEARNHRPAELPLAVTLGDGAETDASRSWVFVDRRPKDGVRGWGVRCNRHHIVFTAMAEETELAIGLRDDAPADCEIGVNGIGVWPYVPE